MIIATNEQETIWNDMENESHHMMVYAGAGTGKTYTIIEGANRIVGSKGFLAFNKSIATEIGKKVPLDCEAMTFHSLGLSSLKMARRDCKVDTKKTYNIINAVMGREYNSGATLNRLISLIKSTMIEWDDRDAINEIISEYNLEFDGIREENNGIMRLPQIKNMCMDMSIVDFDDMIWLPVVLELPVKHYDTVFVDEAQDFNEVQRRLILKTCNGGRMIVVGDPRQAIYGFRGADSTSMDLFKETLLASDKGVKQYPLTTTFRCPRLVVEEANRYVEGYFCMEGAEDGTVNVNSQFNPSIGDLVLCRTNAPLVGHCFSLIAEGIPAYVMGRDIGYSLSLMVNKVTQNGSMAIEDFLPMLETHVQRKIEVFMRADKLTQVESLVDKKECIIHLTGRTTTVQGLLGNIKTIFGDGKKAGVVFSTIHKAKGLEANTVWIIETQLMPHPMAKSKADRKQEMNLCYVAITRAKKILNYVGGRTGHA
jgi:superfamily I DNA/RNA helicase|tara:strand:+ start:4700 stop:6142 length:1443 start_codon:yes stop_codon:yes gene_type:complete